MNCSAIKAYCLPDCDPASSLTFRTQAQSLKMVSSTFESPDFHVPNHLHIGRAQSRKADS